MTLLDRVLQRVTAAVRLAVSASVVAATLWSLQHQVRANMLDFLMPTRVAGLFKPLEDDVLSDYFWKRPYWSINTDLVWFAIGRRKFPPLEHVRDRIPAPTFESLSAEVRRSVSLNLLWMATAGHPERRPPPTEDGQRSARSAGPPGR